MLVLLTWLVLATALLGGPMAAAVQAGPRDASPRQVDSVAPQPGASPGAGFQRSERAQQATSVVPRAQLGIREWFGSPGLEPPKRAWQKKKNPTVAMISSFVIPGLGQLYNEREFWAVVVAGIQFGFLADVIIEARLTNRYRTLKNIPIDETLPPEEQEEMLEEKLKNEVLFLLHRDNRIQSSWLLGLTMLLSGVQSYVDAHLFDFDADAPLQFGPSYGRLNGGALRLRF